MAVHRVRVRDQHRRRGRDSWPCFGLGIGVGRPLTPSQAVVAREVVDGAEGDRQRAAEGEQVGVRDRLVRVRVRDRVRARARVRGVRVVRDSVRVRVRVRVRLRLGLGLG